MAAPALEPHVSLKPATAAPRLEHTGFPFQVEQWQLSRFRVSISVGSAQHFFMGEKPTQRAGI